MSAFGSDNRMMYSPYVRPGCTLTGQKTVLVNARLYDIEMRNLARYGYGAKAFMLSMTETAIDRGFTRDLYVSLGEPLSATAWSVRVYYKPLVGWIWGGCVLMALGGVLAVLDRRYRVPRRVVAPTTPAPKVQPDSPVLAKTSSAP